MRASAHSSMIYISQDAGATSCPSTGEWGGKVQCVLIHTVEYYSAVERTKFCHLQ